MVALGAATATSPQEQSSGTGAQEPFRLCANAQHDACNWLVPSSQPGLFCLACGFNHTIPDLSVAANLTKWRKIEGAKHHLIYSLKRLGLPLHPRVAGAESDLTFEFLASEALPKGEKVITGHENGCITLNLAEADDAVRARNQANLHEPYRTLLGHFRHEIGHYYWDLLVHDEAQEAACAEVFGDATADYGEALKAHYARGELGPQENFVTPYASAHPWEDFAETWAHYMHMVDTLEMVASCGLRLDQTATGGLATNVDFDPYAADRFDDMIGRWIPLAIAVNNVNRCMGQPDLYPFVLTPVMIGKLLYIHNLIHVPRAG